ncbi:hypothetical protein BKA62DRAFT_601774, partial [Auriculariales sp. MPI-PUGE-AT-0066]
EAEVVATVRALLARLDDADKDVASSAQLSGLDDAYTTLKRIADGGSVPNTTLNAIAPLLRSWIDHGLFERAAHDVPANVESAARAVFNLFAASALPSADKIQTLQKQLHQLFLFAVTCAPALPPLTAPAMHQLSGVLHFIGALNKLQLAPPPTATGPPAVPDLGTAIFRCTAPQCPKVFSRLFYLQLHARLHDPPGRSQTLRCSECTETFNRAWDLNKHLDAHTYRCSGCSAIFSSRDVVEDHQASDPDGACDGAEIEERVPPRMDYAVEDGEVVPEAFYRAVNAALPLQGVLQTYVSTAVASGAGLAANTPGAAPGAAPATPGVPRQPGALPGRPPVKAGSVAPRPGAPRLAGKTPTAGPGTPSLAFGRPAVGAKKVLSAKLVRPDAIAAAAAAAAAMAAGPGPGDATDANDLIAQLMSNAAALAEAELWDDYGEEETGQDGAEWAADGAEGAG